MGIPSAQAWAQNVKMLSTKISDSLGGRRGLCAAVSVCVCFGEHSYHVGTAPMSCRDGSKICGYVLPTDTTLIQDVGTPWLAFVSQYLNQNVWI